MIKVIYNASTANNGEQHKDSNNNITQYLEFNKDRILNLGEKNYENILEVLTKNAIDTASSNSTLSLLQSSSAFPNLSDQSDKYSSEESEGFHNNKGDIAD
jgi:hypothetical protein